MVHFKTFILTLLCAVVFAGIASATLAPTDVAGNVTTINHGGSFTLTFKLNNTGTADVTDVKVNLPSLSIGQWTTVKVGDTSIQNLQSPVQLITAANKISSGATSPTITLTFTSTLNAASAGTYSSPITFTASDAAGSVETTPLTYSLTVTPSSSLVIDAKGTTVSAIQNATLNVTNFGNVPFTATNGNRVTLTTGGDFALVLSETSFDLIPGQSKIPLVIVSLAPTVDLNALRFGTNTASVTATAGNVSTSASFSIKKTFCSAGEKGKSTNLSINRVDISSTGDDDDTWKPLDKVTIEVKVENNGNEDLKDVVVELGLFDSAGRNIVGKLDFEDTKDDEKITINKINDDDEDTVTFIFTVPGDFDSGTYKLAVKSYSKKVGETNLCTDSSSDLDNNIFHEIRVDREDDEGKFIAFSGTKVSPAEATCSDTVVLSTDVFNIGDEDQDRVKVKLTSRDLQIDANQEIRNMDIGDKKLTEFTFIIPNVADKAYFLELSSEYDYRSGNYHEFSDETFKFPLKVFGCIIPVAQVTNASDIAITASLESEAKAGEQMTVKATLRNPGSQQVNAIVTAKGYESWATLDSISERLVPLAPGESKDVTITFSVNPTASGEQSFVLEISGGSRVQTQEVAVTFEKPTTSGLGSLGTNKLAWVIGIINVILIIIIIIIAVKISRR